ncbi:MAG: S8 family serine peptidase [Caldilineaceae bacterium]
MSVYLAKWYRTKWVRCVRFRRNAPSQPTCAMPPIATHPLTTAFLVALTFAVLLFGSFRLPAQAVDHDDDKEIEIKGVVTAAPAQADGQGEWQILGDNRTNYTLLATADTKFKNGIPQIRQRVKVKGLRNAEQQIVAEEMEREETEENGESRLKGILLTAPTDGIGDWIIQVGATVTYTVIANNGTRLDDGVPTTGAWLEVRGQWQLDGSLLATRIRLDNHELNQVIVRLANGVLSSTIASQYNLVPLQTLLASGNIHLFQTGEDREKAVVNQLKANSAQVVWAELNYAGGIPEGHGYKTWHWGGDDPAGYINQNAFAQVNLTGAPDVLQGENILIAVLDTGVDLDHTALAPHLLAGWDMVADDNLPDDEGDGLGWGHGTHVTGILTRMAPQSKILPVRVLDSNGRGNIFTLAYAIEWAVAQGADVINLSLGAESDSRILHDTIQQAAAQGVIVVAAAGNTNTITPQFPASYPETIAVTAVDGDNRKADFANYGAHWVDLAAPGVGITSTIVGPLGSGYASWSGTSMATAFISGAAALARQAMPTASASQIIAQLTNYSQDLDKSNPLYVGQLGGLLDVGTTLSHAPTVTSTPPPATTATPTVTPTVSTPAATPQPTPTAPVPAEIQHHLYLPVIK